MKNLDTNMLLMAYSQGYFPMPHPDTEEICWFNPDPRAIIPLEGFHCSRSLKRSIRKFGYTFTINQSFQEVMSSCAREDDTWINEEFKRAYYQLHQLGFAHSLEVWAEDELVGGLYGVSIASAFFAESKFHKKTDASKAALYFLVEHMKKLNFSLLEVQFLTPHLNSLGAIEISASHYQNLLSLALAHKNSFTPTSPQ